MPGPIRLAVTMPALLLAACAAYPVPHEQVAASAAAIESARIEASGAYASREMALAREKLELSARWIEAKDNQPARWLAEQAEVDAELARVRAAAQRAVDEAKRHGRVVE